MFIDTHCHLTMLDHSRYPQAKNHDEVVDLAVAQAIQANVSQMMAISVALEDRHALANIAQRHPQVGYSIGVHPCSSAQELAEATVDNLVTYAQDERVWALGETGLDYYHDTSLIAQQKQSFANHIHASKIVKKPVIVHTRSAKTDTVDVIRAEQSSHGILHCFTEDWETARQLLDLGYYISFSGIISFKNAQDLRDVAKKVPLDRILIETDSPYLAPVPYRGKPNEPQYVPYVAQVLADLHDMSLERMAEITTGNFMQLRQAVV